MITLSSDNLNPSLVSYCTPANDKTLGFITILSILGCSTLSFSGSVGVGITGVGLTFYIGFSTLFA